MYPNHSYPRQPRPHDIVANDVPVLWECYKRSWLCFTSLADTATPKVNGREAFLVTHRFTHSTIPCGSCGAHGYSVLLRDGTGMSGSWQTEANGMVMPSIFIRNLVTGNMVPKPKEKWFGTRFLHTIVCCVDPVRWHHRHDPPPQRGGAWFRCCAGVPHRRDSDDPGDKLHPTGSVCHPIRRHVSGDTVPPFHGLSLLTGTSFIP